MNQFGVHMNLASFCNKFNTKIRFLIDFMNILYCLDLASISKKSRGLTQKSTKTQRTMHRTAGWISKTVRALLQNLSREGVCADLSRSVLNRGPRLVFNLYRTGTLRRPLIWRSTAPRSAHDIDRPIASNGPDLKREGVSYNLILTVQQGSDRLGLSSTYLVAQQGPGEAPPGRAPTGVPPNLPALVTELPHRCAKNQIEAKAVTKEVFYRK
jgi:hypothetical protein